MPFASPGYLPNPGIEPRFPALQADVLPSEPPGKPFRSGKAWLFSLFNYFEGLSHCFLKQYNISLSHHQTGSNFFTFSQTPLIFCAFFFLWLVSFSLFIFFFLVEWVGYLKYAYNSIIKKKTAIKNGQIIWIENFSKKIWHMRRCLSLIIAEMKAKTTVR